MCVGHAGATRTGREADNQEMPQLTNVCQGSTRPPVDLAVPSHGPAQSFAQLRAGTGRHETCVLQAISCEMAHVTFEGSTASFGLGSDVSLVLSSSNKAQAFGGVVWSREDAPDRRDYVVRFALDQKNKDLLEDTIRRIFNNRAGLRVAPRTKDCTVALRVRPEDTWVDADLKDVSAGGLGFLCPLVVEPPSFAQATTFEVRLGFLSKREPVLARVTVTNRKLFKGAVRYGTRFDEAMSPAFEATRVLIAEYVALRQREILADAARRTLR